MTMTMTNIQMIPAETAFPHGTYYWSIGGNAFIPFNPDTDSVHYSNDGVATTDGNGISWIAPVNLPHGARMTSVIVTGSAAAETWLLMRTNRTDTFTGTNATANFNTADVVIASAVIDNNTNFYYLRTSTLDATDTIIGAFIIYTI